MRLAAALLLALPACSRAADPFGPALAKARADGLSVSARAEGRAGGDRLLAAVLSRGGTDELQVYLARRGRAFLVYLHPASGEALSLEGGFTDRLFGDGAAGLLYRGRDPRLGSETLYALRVEKGRARRVGAFPGGRLVDVGGEGRPVIAAVRRPLGRWLVLGCDMFATLADGVQAVELRAWRDGRFEDASARHAAWFSAQIVREEEALRARPADPSGYGPYAARALSLYHLYAAKGEGRLGWRRFSELIEPPPSDRLAARCIAQAKDELRRRLEIPADW